MASSVFLVMRSVRSFSRSAASAPVVVRGLRRWISSMFADRYGLDLAHPVQWEVEALEPAQLQRLVLAAVDPYIDHAVLARQVACERELRCPLADFVRGWGAAGGIRCYRTPAEVAPRMVASCVASRVQRRFCAMPLTARALGPEGSGAGGARHRSTRPDGDASPSERWLGPLSPRAATFSAGTPMPHRPLRVLATGQPTDLLFPLAHRAGVAIDGPSSLSRPGARCRDCSRSVSPDLSPNPPCVSQRNGLSTVSAVRRGSQAARGWGSCWLGIGNG